MYIHKLQRKRCPANEEGGSDKFPFGYKRAEVIGGLINSVALVSLSGYVSVFFLLFFHLPSKLSPKKNANIMEPVPYIDLL